MDFTAKRTRKRSLKVREMEDTLREAKECKSHQRRECKRVSQARKRYLESLEPNRDKLVEQAQYKATKRLAETPGQKRHRLTKQAQYESIKCLLESPRQNIDRLAKQTQY